MEATLHLLETTPAPTPALATPISDEASPGDAVPSARGGTAPSPALALVEELVREPAVFAEHHARAGQVDTVRALLGTLVVGAGVFGVVLGAYRGGWQVLYCAAKLPLVLLATLVVCTPPFVALARALGTGLAPRHVITLTLGSCARFALVLAGLAPVLWLLQGVLGYHGTILAVVAACALAGLAAGSLLFRGLAGARGASRLAGAAFVAVFALVGLQASWLLRPFLVRPRTQDVPFVRPLEGDLADAVNRSSLSAAGIYRRPAPPLPSSGGRVAP